MPFKIDENLPVEVKMWLIDAGFDALTVRDQELVGSPDPLIASVVAAEGRCLITLDLDFADMRAYPPSLYPGIIVLRPRKQTTPRILRLLPQLVELLKLESPMRRLWIVDESGTRIRGEDS